MLKRLLLSFFALAFLAPPHIFMSSANAAVASVDYVHATILELKDVTVPVQMLGGGTNYTIPVSLKYFMKQIDKANEALNGTATTDYAGALSSTESTNLVEVGRARADIENLIEYLGPPPSFSIRLSSTSGNVSFSITAMGKFTVDWGDGSAIQTINKTNTTSVSYTHNYSLVGIYDIIISGKATGYTTTTSLSSSAAISFVSSANKQYYTNITGSIGHVFPTLGDTVDKQPRFYMAFYACAGLTSLSSGLFDGVSGILPANMFRQTFYGCTGLTSIPSGLFGDLSGTPGEYVFSQTFYGCNGLTGSIPSGLFGTLYGSPAPYMFNQTFHNCLGLTGSIPAVLFGTLSGEPAPYMFSETFYNCIGLTGSIPSGLFGTLSGNPANYMFYCTFTTCRNLTGSIPAGLFGTLSGNPANYMFCNTFNGCRELTGIEGGIWDLTGLSNTNANYAFDSMFYGANKIITAPPTIAPGSSINLWDHFTVLNPGRPFAGCSGMIGYASIPAAWRN